MLRKIIRYAIVGIFGTLSYMLILTGLVEVLGFSPVVSSIVSFIIILIGSYYGNHYFTFQSDRAHSYALPRYIIVSITALLLNTVIIFLTVNILGWWYMYSQAITVFVIPLSNFLLNFYWSFSERTGPRVQSSR